jgi:hypothetical protein
MGILSGSHSFSEVDNKLTYIVGYRNVYNIAVLFVAFMAFISPDSITKALSLVLIVLGLKWFLSQVRENIDVVMINEIKLDARAHETTSG